MIDLADPEAEATARGWRTAARRCGRSGARRRGGRPGGPAGDRRRGPSPERSPCGRSAAAEAAAEAAVPAPASAPPAFDASESGEWLRRHQATTSRTLFRTFDALRKIRKEFGDGPNADEEPAGADGQRPASRRVASDQPV